MSTNLELARDLYKAFETADAQALLSLLHPRFKGVVTAGLPHDFGGIYEGPDEMLAECWARVFGELDVRPAPNRFLETQDDHVIVLGDYVGRARASGRELKAAFAHVLKFEDERIASLEQITDSRLWAEALTPLP